MPKNKNKAKKSTHKGGGRKGEREVSPTAITYRGPVQMSADLLQSNTYTIVCSQEVPVTSTVGGAITNVFSSNPTGTTGWGGFQSVFDEYRVLAFDIMYMPNNRYDSGLTVNQTALLTVGDHNANAALSSYTNAANYESLKMCNTGDPWRRSMFMNGVQEAAWINTTASPLNNYYIKIFATGVAVSTTYGIMIKVSSTIPCPR